MRTRRAVGVAMLIVATGLLGGCHRSPETPVPSVTAPTAPTVGVSGTRTGPSATAYPTSPRPSRSVTTKPVASIDPATGLGIIRESQLTAEARRTLTLIRRGEPYPYSRDGIVYNNYNRVLPQHPKGWYHEFTVPTPGESDRGARRLILGKDGALFYTADHYTTFRLIAEGT